MVVGLVIGDSSTLKAFSLPRILADFPLILKAQRAFHIPSLKK
jgi:hypothetical protein